MYIRSTIIPSLFISLIAAAPNGVNPPSTPPAVTVDAAVAYGLSQLCVMVTYRTPSSCSWRRTAMDDPVWCMPSAPSIEGILPFVKAECAHVEVSQNRNSSISSMNRFVTSICSSVSRTLWVGSSRSATPSGHSTKIDQN